jgi:hypothetical protein
MRNKTFLLFFFCWALHSFLYAKVVPPQFGPKPSVEELLADKKEDRVAQMEKVFKSVASDTSTHKVVSFDSGFRESYINEPEFKYDQEDGSKTFFARLLEKIGRLLKKMFGFGPLNKVGDVTILIFKIICGLIVLVVIYFIIRLIMNHNGTWFFQKKNESLPFDINDAEQLIQHADFDQLISEVEKLGDTRQSIRLFYLWLLKDLKEKELIVWLPEKTNADYQFELKEEGLRKQFSYLSYLYSYIWYGEFTITDEDYIVAKKAFLNYLRKDRQNG